MSTCCHSTECGKSSTWALRVGKVLAWVLPSAVLALIPKCPACLVVYVALWTGLGLSLTTATYVRWTMLLVCVASLLYLTVKSLRCLEPVIHHANYLKGNKYDAELKSQG